MVSTGYVGSNTISSVLQMSGNEIVTVPTVLYSNHLGHSTVGGYKISEDLLTTVLNGILELGIIKDTAIIITGFIGSAKQVEIIADFIRAIKTLKPQIRYLCDPVMGDVDKGLYVEPDIPNALVKYLLPLADLLTPNQYEIETIIGKHINIKKNVLQLLKGQFDLTKQKVVVTGVSLKDVGVDFMYNCILEEKGCEIIEVKKIDLNPPGTGDMFTAYLCLLMHRGMMFNNAVELSSNIVSKVLLNMSKETRAEFELQDILYSINIERTINYILA